MMGQYTGLTSSCNIEYFGRFITSTSSQLAYNTATDLLLEKWGRDVHVQLLVTDNGVAGVYLYCVSLPSCRSRCTSC